MRMYTDMDITSIILITSTITIIMRTIKFILTTDTDSLMVMLCTFTIITITSTTTRDSEMATELTKGIHLLSLSFHTGTNGVVTPGEMCLRTPTPFWFPQSNRYAESLKYHTSQRDKAMVIYIEANRHPR